MLISYLNRIVVETKGDIQTSRLPNNKEIMDKINEIIKFVNYLDQNKQSKPIEGFGTRKTF